MKYRFEIVSSPESKTEVCIGCMFEEEGIAPIAYLNSFANEHFGRPGLSLLGDRLDMHRIPIDERTPSSETLLCSAAFLMIEDVPTIHMISGPLMKQEIYGHA